MRGEGELNKRRRDILTAIVRQFISNGVPVGSKAVSEQLPEPLSAATIRNVMVELEAEGYLAQPHVSAGRQPTDKAYRFFVDQVVDSTRLGPATEEYIDQKLGSLRDVPARLMASTSHVLSEVSHHVGLVLSPAREEKLLEHIRFEMLPDQRVLAVMVSKPDLVENKLLQVEGEFSQEELDRTANFLNSEFRGWSLRAIRLEVFKRLEEERLLCDRLLKNVATLFMWGAWAEEEPGTLYVDGTANILDRPEFEDASRVRQLLEAIEEKEKLIKILGACLESSNRGVRILIGREYPENPMQQCAFIMAPYYYRERAVGALGVVGPTRMEYERAITAVNYVAHVTSKLLSAN